MDLFKKAKESEKRQSKKDCLFCGNLFKPNKSSLNRGWGLFCSKSCAVSYRNRLKNMNPSERKREDRERKLRQLGI